MKRPTPKLSDLGISEARYRELEYFCYQYKEKRLKAHRLLDPAPQRATPGRGSDVADPTFQAAARRERLLQDIEDIEQSAIEAAGSHGTVLASWLLSYVTCRDKPPIDTIPCGRRQFYALRRRFFVILDGRR